METGGQQPAQAQAAPNRDQIEQQTANWASTKRLQYFDARRLKDIDWITSILDLAHIRSYNVLPIAQTGNDLVIGYTPQTEAARLPLLQKLLAPKTCHFQGISQIGLEEIVEKLEHNDLWRVIEATPAQFEELLSSVVGQKAFTYVCQYAFHLGATDIHLEPKIDHILIRCRIDGALEPIGKLSRHNYQVMLSAIQIESNMKWGTDNPQAGRISMEILGKDRKPQPVNVRLESIPTFNGEELVVRILNINTQFLDLKTRGLRPPILENLLNAIARTDGMIIAAGPTGSGKTSMLYSIIKELNKPDVKIVTLEDPIEYSLPNASQIPVHSDNKESFIAKFRAVMREDPNVIMIGEIRDLDTARTALQAALTGHLVLTTFHANSAGAAVTRLMDVVTDNPLMVSALQLIQAQRLIRQLCTHCRTPVKLDETEMAGVKEIFTNLDAKLYPIPSPMQIYNPLGCDQCRGTGYKGRLILVEQLQVSEKLKQLIIDQKNQLTASAITAAAMNEGMLTLMQDGVLRALSGETSLAELRRTVGLPEVLVELSKASASLPTTAPPAPPPPAS